MNSVREGTGNAREDARRWSVQKAALLCKHTGSTRGDIYGIKTFSDFFVPQILGVVPHQQKYYNAHTQKSRDDRQDQERSVEANEPKI